jgi:hypothetical protein
MNPELRRNLWLELSAHRLLATPALIGLVSALILVNSDGRGYGALATVAGFASLLLLAAWGSKLAADGIGDEARNRTWDAQRLTSIGPWQMTCGKLAGATAFAWYGGGLCLLVFIAAGVGQLSAPVLRLAGLIVAGSVLCHAVAFTGSLMAAQRNPATRSTNALVWMFVLLAVAGSARRWLTVDQGTVAWWGASHASVNFVLVSAMVFAAWAVFGAYRSMCSALHVPTTPWALVVFLCFVSVYLAGFASPSTGSVAGLVAVTGVGVSLAACYGLLFLEQTGAMTLRRLQMRISRRQWLAALQELPGWPVALLLALLFAIGTRFAALRDGGTWAIADAAFVFWLFAVRDAALMHCFAFARQPRRVVATTVLYLALLYGLLPWLLKAFGAQALAGLLLPFSIEYSGPNTAVAAVQALIAVGIAAWRWRRL